MLAYSRRRILLSPPPGLYPGGGSGAERPPKSKWSRFKDGFRTFVAWVFSNVGICVLVVGYLLLGAVCFQQVWSLPLGNLPVFCDQRSWWVGGCSIPLPPFLGAFSIYAQSKFVSAVLKSLGPPHSACHTQHNDVLISLQF